MTTHRHAPAPSTAVVVLAGGTSRRMGRDKAVLEADFGDGPESLLTRTLRIALQLDLPLVLAAGDRRPPVDPALLERTDGPGDRPLHVCPDGPGRGPAAGILGAAAEAPGSALLVLACDLPFLTDRLPRRLLELAAARPVDAVVPRHGGRLHPLAAWYGPEALEALGRRVTAGHLDLVGLLAADRAADPARAGGDGGSIGLRVLEADADILRIEPETLARDLFNCNDPADWERVRREAASHLPDPQRS